LKSKFVPPKIIHKIFPDYIWVSRTEKILITFDDGPIPETTPIILNELEKLNLKAIFFCVGENIEKYPDLGNEIISSGHQIGNHTFYHSNITWTRKNEIELAIKKVNHTLKENLNYVPKFFRPPHGRINFKLQPVLNKLEMQNVMWSLLTYDYKNDINIVKFAFQNYLQNNSIIVLHDSLKSKNVIIDSISFLMEEADKKGFSIGDPSECLKYSF